MDLTFENLLYVESLKPLQNISSGSKGQYPGFAELKENIEELNGTVEGNKCTCNGKTAIIRYNANGNNSFGGISVSCECVVAIVKSDEDQYTVYSGSVEEIGATNESWSAKIKPSMFDKNSKTVNQYILEQFWEK